MFQSRDMKRSDTQHTRTIHSFIHRLSISCQRQQTETREHSNYQYTQSTWKNGMEGWKIRVLRHFKHTNSGCERV